ncbi:peroxiredoxin [Chitinophaga terrae (ex Kim and Jung 2007)]|uniref:TlpA family protein disulfide reductase n=1 Tax=Chitinophaga terrae (ex Kim and Jung 2007) TaxID=408074 RepID=UPI0027825B4D|nr:thioredoxin family protein [Chitinophaga terrae (ex Kim and Jung 2007)]MDQ0107498.1 peroxiredoxin [Chitinophaga terrae (ex Kim and Jung 2007)]
MAKKKNKMKKKQWITLAIYILSIILMMPGIFVMYLNAANKQFKGQITFGSNNHDYIFPQKPVHLSGKIVSNRDTIRLIVGFWRNYITGFGAEYETMKVSLDSLGRFDVTLPQIDHPFRIQIGDAFSHNLLFNRNQIAEPGDSIFILGIIRDQDLPSDSNFTAVFTGKGSAKYQCIQALKKNPAPTMYHIPTTESKIEITDSLINAKLRTVSNFSKEINQDILETMKADIIGDCKFNLSLSIFSDIIYNKSIQPNVKATKKVIFDDIMQKDHIFISNDILSQSAGYTQYVYLKEKLRILFSLGRNQMTYKALYENIKSLYDGKLKDKLLAYCSLNTIDLVEFFEGSDPDEFRDCLEDAANNIKVPWLNEPVKKLLSTRAKGAPAFNFSLPLDSSSRRINLEDLKGNVVLVDMWGYICTSCYRFAQAFHEKVYPEFQNNKNFKVISIMLDPYADRDKYLQRLRMENGPAYTFNTYINLYGGKNEQIAREIEKYYNINVAPFIILIDKKGRIYSTTIPFFTEKNSPNIEKLSALIRKALAES